MNYKTVCGLEVHCELATKSKIFCSCKTDFGAEPNSQVCPVCLGLPGALPVLNRRVVEFAVKTGLALNCEITRLNKFDRKNYFYPDLPKSYQISQLYLPICKNGFFELSGGKKIRIHEIHMEEDAGKLIHDEKTLVNYNRCGVPLLEIVTEPDFESADEAVEFLEKLRALLQAIGVSDCKMEEGSMRADINVSVMPEGSKALGTRTEMKNVSSFKAARAAIEYEAKRQIKVLEGGGIIEQETRRFDEKEKITLPMRSKETAKDYKYFPEPDIPPLEISEALIEEMKSSLPELPEAKRKRYIEEYGLSEYDSEVICRDKAYFELFEITAEITKNPKVSANWIMGEMMMLIKESSKAPDFEKYSLGEIINMLEEGKISRASAKQTFAAVFYKNVSPKSFVKENELEILKDFSLLESVAESVLKNNPKALEEYKSGKEKSFNFLLGQCMKELKGKASASDIKRILIEKMSTE